MIKTPNSFKPHSLFNIWFQWTEGRRGGCVIDLNLITQGSIHRAIDICLNVDFQTQCLANLLVIANAIHLNQVFLIWTTGNYPIHLKGTLSFNINHSVRLHQLHCVLVTAAAEWWMRVLWVHSPAVWLDSGQFRKQMIGKSSSYLGHAFSLSIQSLVLPTFSPCC